MRRAFFLIALGAALSNAPAQQGGVELFVGETLFVGGTRLSATWLHTETNGLLRSTSSAASPDGLALDRDTVVLGAMHGLRRGTDVTVLAPVIGTQAAFGAPPSRRETDHFDLGDVSVTVRQRLHHAHWERSAWATSMLVGVQTPTGATDERQGGALLPANLQAGSGSWDPFVSLASTLELDRLRLDANALYFSPTEGSQQFEAGDVLSTTLTVGYRALMTKYPGPTVSVKGGVRYRREGRARQAGVGLEGFGREELALRAGATWHPTPDLDVVFTFEVPVYQDVNELQPDVDYRLLAGVGWRF
ncbi:MAG: transporter [Planctomycetota bacterium]|nr:transporter [Planctomycetota bacterium]